VNIPIPRLPGLQIRRSMPSKPGWRRAAPCSWSQIICRWRESLRSWHPRLGCRAPEFQRGVTDTSLRPLVLCKI